MRTAEARAFGCEGATQEGLKVGYDQAKLKIIMAAVKPKTPATNGHYKFFDLC
jgi:hypothetical protein